MAENPAFLNALHLSTEILEKKLNNIHVGQKSSLHTLLSIGPFIQIAQSTLLE